MIDENTDVEWEGELIYEIFQYFQGETSRNIYVSFQKEPVFIWERRDGKIIKSFLDRGLIVRPFSTENDSFIITQYGREIAEQVSKLIKKEL